MRPFTVRGAMPLRHPLASALLACCALGASASAAAQDTSNDAATKAQIEAMRQQIQQQQQLMQQMQQRLDELERSRQQPAPVAAAPAAAAPVSTAELPQYGVESHVHKPPSALPGVSEPPPEGYVRIGDTGTLMKIDVVAQLDAMVDDTHIAPDLFLPSSIPVQGQPFHDGGWRSTQSAKQSIIRLDFRRDTPLGLLKVVYKNNFFGSNGDMGFNTQYFYGELQSQRWSLLAGYYLSGFTDIDVFPNTLDYEGPNSFTFKYSPQVRFTPVLYKSGESQLTLPMSIEKPNADIALIEGFNAYSRWPDATVGLRWETPDWHVQWANLFRNLAVEAEDGRSVQESAYATQFTAAAGVFGDDSIQGWASFGKGYANFLQDISGFGLDAAFNTQGELKPIKAEGYGMGYTHSWNDEMSSSASYGYVKIEPNENDNLLISPEQPKSTQYASLNWAWQFSERAMFGVEYLWGKNTLLNDNDGTAQRVQATLRYDLNP